MKKLSIIKRYKPICSDPPVIFVCGDCGKVIKTRVAVDGNFWYLECEKCRSENIGILYGNFVKWNNGGVTLWKNLQSWTR